MLLGAAEADAQLVPAGGHRDGEVPGVVRARGVERVGRRRGGDGGQLCLQLRTGIARLRIDGGDGIGEVEVVGLRIVTMLDPAESMREDTQHARDLVEEYARAYLSHLQRPYGPEDLLLIARGQVSSEEALVSKANKVLICDTDLYVIKVWSHFKYGYCHPEILETIASRKYDLYLLSYIDGPWQFDPQREHPTR